MIFFLIKKYIIYMGLNPKDYTKKKNKSPQKHPAKKQQHNKYTTPPTEINKAADNDMLLQTIRCAHHSTSGKTEESPTKPKST